MEYVIFDLEWNQPFANDISFMKRTGLPVSGEIIQIGAIKLDEDLELVDTFNILVKPQYLTKMHKHVEQLTHITSDDLSMGGLHFPDAYRQFDRWCGEDSILLTWGSDDIVMLRENLKLHGIHAKLSHPWYDAQLIYAYLMHNNLQQVALTRAMEELGLSRDELTAHNALHDSIFTGRVCKAIPLHEGMADYERIIENVYAPAYFPDDLSFFIYENFIDKRQVFHDRRVNRAYCPLCQERMKLQKIQRLSGDKFLALAHCKIHGDFAVHWRIGKHMKKGGLLRFYVTKSVTEAPEKLHRLYAERTELNRKKEEAYLKRLGKRQRAAEVQAAAEAAKQAIKDKETLKENKTTDEQ